MADFFYDKFSLIKNYRLLTNDRNNLIIKSYNGDSYSFFAFPGYEITSHGIPMGTTNSEWSLKGVGAYITVTSQMLINNPSLYMNYYFFGIDSVIYQGGIYNTTVHQKTNSEIVTNITGALGIGSSSTQIISRNTKGVLLESNVIKPELYFPLYTNEFEKDGFWWLRKGVAWTPPNLKTNINGQLKEYDNGWVNINGQLRQIDKMWTKVNGILREV